MIGFPIGLVPRSYLDAARALDEYFARAHLVGVSREKAETILAEEMDVAKASPTLTSKDALSRARRRVIEAAYE